MSTLPPGAQPDRDPIPLRPFPGPRRSADARLPTPLTSLVGRARELSAIGDLLRRSDVRLVSLTGPGGVGKTRLALAVAAAVAADFADGVAFVPLAPVRDPDLVATTVAGVLSLSEAGGREPVAAVLRYLRDRHLLLVLDNFEHLLPAAALAAEWLSACPRLTILVTSRAVLRVSGEHGVAVSPLAVPDLGRLPPADRLVDLPSVRLFVERATAARSDFALTEAEAPAVAAICARLDGLPLALELAAARVRVLPPAALLRKLEHRLVLLTGGGRDQPSRLRSLRDAIAWSDDLLSPAEQALFRRLAVFVGGFRLEAAEAVASRGVEESGSREAERSDSSTPRLSDSSTTLDLVAALVDHSLLRQGAEADGGPDDSRGVPGTSGAPRYLMLETVREYALERLAASGEAEVTSQRHAACLLALAEEAAPLLRGPDQIAWLDRLEAELPNVRAALVWARDAGDAARGLRLAATLWTFWVVRGHVPEGRRWLEAFLTAAAGSTGRLPALLALADLAQRQGDYAAATTWAEEALGLARAGGDRAGEAAALRGLGSVATSRGAAALHSLGDAALAEAEFARAEACLEQGVALAREVGDSWGAAKALHWLANVRVMRGDAAGVAAQFEVAAAAFRGLGDRWQLSQVAATSGFLAHTVGDLPRARAAFAEALALAQRLGYEWFGGLCLVGLAAVAADGGEGEHAARLLGAAAGRLEASGEPLRRSDQAWHDRAVVAARAALGEADFAAAWTAGAALPPEAAIDEALAAAAAAAVVPPQPAVPTAHGRLTPREIEVLRLIAEGRSDREIAAALSLSYRSVTNHVTGILTKLDAPSRAAAAAHAVRLGLA